VNKHGLFRPAGGEMTVQVSNRVTPVNDTTYAVPFVWAWYQTQTPVSPAAAWYTF